MLKNFLNNLSGGDTAQPSAAPAQPTASGGTQDPIIAQMISPYIDGFSSYSISDAALQAEIDAFKAKVQLFAQQNTNLATFHSNFAESGLQAEYMNLITRAATSGYSQQASAPAAESTAAAPATESASAAPQLPTVKEFVEQYRTAYNEVKKAEWRTRGAAAYEQIFDVANQTDDMLKAQIILEKERLLWKIVSEDSLDIFENIYKAADPLYRFVSAPLKIQADIYAKATCDEQLSYLIEKAEYSRLQVAKHAHMEITLIASLAKMLLIYCKSKADVWRWQSETLVQGGVQGMIIARATLRNILDFMQAHYDLTFSDVLADEHLKIWLLNPEAKDGLGRIKTTLHPHNLDVFKDIMENEILTSQPVSELLKRKTNLIARLDLSDTAKPAYEAAAAAKASELNASLTYFKYLQSFEAMPAVADIKPTIER